MPSSSASTIVVLDRDGTLNDDRYSIITSPADWQPIPGALEAVARLNQAGFKVVIATNQSGLGRGLFDMATMNAVHDKMHKLLAQEGARVEAVFFCPHTRDDQCDCRKPKAGLFEKISQRFSVPATQMVVAGNTVRHVQAGDKVGASTHLILTGKCAAYSPENPPEGLPGSTQMHADLSAFVDQMLGQDRVREAT
jgi:D-glycero-D-manno-heptose 1,7-bisphosphate phosphatase